MVKSDTTDNLTDNQKKEIRQKYHDSYTDHERKLAKKPEHYLDLYEQYFLPLRHKKLMFLELGIYGGQSLRYFSNIFPKATIIGLDINPCPVTFDTNRIKTYQGSQDDPDIIKRIIAENNISNFDIIVDDCSHIGSLTCDSFNLLFPHLKKEGLYVIEDWETGYKGDYTEGAEFNPDNHLIYKKQKEPVIFESHQISISRFLKQLIYKKQKESVIFDSHQYGIPGFLKQLSDEVAMHAIGGRCASKPSQINFLHIYKSIAFMMKSP